MRLRRRIGGVFLAALCVAGAATPADAQRALVQEHGFMPMPALAEDSLAPAQYREIWDAIGKSRARLALAKAGARPSFGWPLRPARGYSDPGFYRIASYVDHDPAFPGHVRDFTCGARSYDRDNGYNHQGTDISPWPDGWNLMARRQVEIVAAAPGTVVLKSDGNFDQSCDFNTGTWNAVYVQHDDGSIAWYGHMKNGSLTAKAIGERVVAGEYLGNVGSSGNSTGPHLHFEVYDSAQRLVDPFQGQCNTFNSDSWWAAQQPYVVTRVNRVFAAGGIPVFSTCGADGHMQDPGTTREKTAFAPNELAYFVAAVRDIEAGQSPSFTLRRPDGTVWRTYVAEPSGQFYSAAYWFTSFFLDPQEPSGVWMLEVEVNGSIAKAPFTVTPEAAPIVNYTDLWWNPGESGWGVNLNHQGDTLFATWFTYDTDRGGLWLVMSDAQLQADGSFAGAIYRTTGTPLAQINAQPAANSPPATVGDGSFRFASAQRGTFSYSVNGITQQKPIERQVFSTPAACRPTAGDRASLTNYQDLWWNPAEPGWGINLAHQGETIFATWFTYGAGGRGQWLVASDVRRRPTGEFRGRLYRTTGTPFHQIAGASAVSGTPADVGEVTFTFVDGANGRLDYIVDGVAQSKSIERQVFGVTTPLCK